jgi:hypothetical protein
MFVRHDDVLALVEDVIEVPQSEVVIPLDDQLVVDLILSPENPFDEPFEARFRGPDAERLLQVPPGTWIAFSGDLGPGRFYTNTKLLEVTSTPCGCSCHRGGAR